MEPAANLDCLDPETLAAYLDGLLAIEAIGRADRHIDHCRVCRGELSALAATHSFPAGSGGSFIVIDGAPIEGRLGRYELMRELGRGSMGVVVRAYDPELARAVAVKILSPRLWDGIDEEDARARLRREAQAMARLTHPNVVTVYDVATHGDAIFVAMELVEGVTLRDFVRTPRPWRETLGVCVRAGRGLAAAHAAKLIHRDYKPENVLCGADGRVVVSDFGLARLDDDRPAVDGDAAATVTTLAGTPAYMAPEVVGGAPATVASDQFSFCVATYEALYGERPFAGETLDQLRAHVAAGVPRDAPADREVPPWLRAMLVRGLANDPAARFGSMTALVDALEAGGSPRRGRAWIAGAAVLAVGVAAGAFALSAGPSSRPACELDEAELAGAWDPPLRHALEAAVQARPADRVAHVTAALETYARGWLAVRRDACAATRIRGDQSERVLEARNACLDRGRRELGELVTLITAEPAVVDRGVEAVYRLRDPLTCVGAIDEAPRDPAARALAARARSDTDRAAAVLAAGKAPEAIAIAGGVITSVSGRDAFAVLAEALAIRGRAELLLGRLDAAEASLAEALTAAERARADHLVAEIWVDLVQATGAHAHRFEAAAANVRAAEAAFTRADPGPALRARYAYVVGVTLLAQGKLEDARGQLERALTLTGDARGGDRGLVHAALCDVHRQLRHFDVARTHCGTAIELMTAAFGENHPRLAPTFNVWGALELDAGHPEAEGARGRFAQAIAIFESNALTSDRAYALALSNTAVAWRRSGDVDHAKPLFERARTLFATYHPEHPQRVLPLEGLASIALDLDDIRGAIAMCEEALAVIERVYGKDSDASTIVQFNLALAYQRLPDLDKAFALGDRVIAQSQHPGREAWGMIAHALDLQATIAEHRDDAARAITLRERALAALDKDDDPATRAWIESQLGSTQRKIGKPRLAIAALERAIAYYDRDRSDRYSGGDARFTLARVLWETGRDRRRAIDLATAALADFEAAESGQNLAAHRAEVARWVAEHGERGAK